METTAETKPAGEHPIKLATGEMGERTGVQDRPHHIDRRADDGVRTEHGISPLDPSYNGTVVSPNAGIEQAAAARQEVGLDAPKAAEDPTAGTEAADTAKADKGKGSGA